MRRGHSEILAYRSELDRLADRAGSYFHTSAWLEAWFRVTTTTSTKIADKSTALFVHGPAGEIKAGLLLSPLSRRLHRRVPLSLRYWGFAGSGYGAGDHLGPIGDPRACRTLIRAAVHVSGGAYPLMLESTAARHGSDLLDAGFEVLGTRRCPQLDLSHIDSEADLWDKKQRKEMRRRARRMQELGVAGRWIDDPDEVRATLPEFRRVHVMRWEDQGQSGLFDEPRAMLLSALCEAENPKYRPLLYVLKGQRSVEGVLMLLRCGKTAMAYKSGWNPVLAKYAPGVAMHTAAICRSLDEGFHTYDFLRGTSGHKYSLGAADHLDTTYLYGSGPTAILLRARERRALKAAGPSGAG